jgi:type I restriction enzyme, S subunit
MKVEKLEIESYYLPKNWIRCRLLDVGEIITGKTPSTKIKDYYGKDIPFIKPPNLLNTIVTSYDQYLSKKGATVVPLLPPESVLVSCIEVLGKTGFSTIPVAINQQINGVIFSKVVIPKYGFYYAQTLKPWLYSNSSATVLPIINKGRFQTCTYPYSSIKRTKTYRFQTRRTFYKT